MFKLGLINKRSQNMIKVNQFGYFLFLTYFLIPLGASFPFNSISTLMYFPFTITVFEIYQC